MGKRLIIVDKVELHFDRMDGLSWYTVESEQLPYPWTYVAMDFDPADHGFIFVSKQDDLGRELHGYYRGYKIEGQSHDAEEIQEG